ncbi:hypothetical protein LTR28_002983, partial [Elasticomyces elasticus]
MYAQKRQSLNGLGRSSSARLKRKEVASLRLLGLDAGEHYPAATRRTIGDTALPNSPVQAPQLQHAPLAPLHVSPSAPTRPNPAEAVPDQPRAQQTAAYAGDASVMAYNSAYHEDSDADDEFERSVFTSPTLPHDFTSSPTDSDMTSPEHTPTTFTHSHSGGSHGSPTGLITQWTPEQCADFLSSLGLGSYGETIIEEGVDGLALIALQHADLKDMGMTSVGHRLTILKNVYDTKVRQNVPLDPDHYVPL